MENYFDKQAKELYNKASEIITRRNASLKNL